MELTCFKGFSWLPWWSSGWESICQCRGHGFDPWSRGIPHAMGPLGPCATTAEPAHSRAHGPQLLSPGAAATEALIF